MIEEVEEYQLFAIRYATRPACRRDNFIRDDQHDSPMPLDYFIWTAISPRHIVVIDAGFSAASGAKRGREMLRDPLDGLAAFGVSADQVDDVIITHLHYDHAGNLHRFPNAVFHVQEREVIFATGKYVSHETYSHVYDINDIQTLVGLNYDGRLKFHNGTVSPIPGIKVTLVGGHAHGLQFVTVNTRRGPVVLASDAAHFYDMVETQKIFPIATNILETLDGYSLLMEQAKSLDHIIPGHDPRVMERYPPPRPELSGIVARLDVDPLPQPQ